MAADTSTLKTSAQCDAATAELTAERAVYLNHDVNSSFNDEQDARAESKRAARLTTVTNDVAYHTNALARPDLSAADRKRHQASLLTATYQRDRLTLLNESEEGADEYLGDVNDDQNDGQVAILTASLANVALRKEELLAQGK